MGGVEVNLYYFLIILEDPFSIHLIVNWSMRNQKWPAFLPTLVIDRSREEIHAERGYSRRSLIARRKDGLLGGETRRLVENNVVEGGAGRCLADLGSLRACQTWAAGGWSGILPGKSQRKVNWPDPRTVKKLCPEVRHYQMLVKSSWPRPRPSRPRPRPRDHPRLTKTKIGFSLTETKSRARWSWLEKHGLNIATAVLRRRFVKILSFASQVLW